MQTIGLVRRFLLVALVLSACLVATGVATAEAGSVENHSDKGESHDTTTVETDGAVSGFTLGAGLFAVLVGGAYQLVRD